MHDIFSREPDPLEGMLRPPSPLPESEGLRQAVYSRTRNVLRRRRLLRQFAYAAALLMSFAAGLLVMRVTTRTRVADSRSELERTRGASAPHSGAFRQPHPPAPPTNESALAREWDAFDSDERRGELYRQAGDAYMEDEYDPQSALRCYTNALDHGTKQDLTISTNDNWLLMAIKDARQKENAHAKTGS
ncbi:MAG TPA: hypothetical protein VH682_18210 [Gemmataceae bacterium]|jgi:hypothetical protein